VAPEAHDPTEGDDGEGEERRERGDERGEEVDGPVGGGRRRVLLEEQLDAVGEGLEDPERPGLVGPIRFCMSAITLRMNQM
jgi:hypothetical protein